MSQRAEKFNRHLGEGGAAITAFTDAAKDAANRMRGDFNLPTGFRTAAIAFETADVGGPELPPAPRLTPTEFTPPLPPGVIPGSDGASLPIPPQRPSHTEVHVTFEPGAIVAAPGESAEELAETVIAKLRERAMSQTGNTLQVGIF